jgi:DNA polymerase-3 subunit beta
MRLLGGEFLKYSSRFPAEFGSRAEVASGPLIEAVRRVSLVAERGSPVRLAFGDDEVVIEAGSQGQARAVERVPAVFAGDERVIAFSPHYLLDGLTAAATPPAGRGGEAAEDAPGRGSTAGRIRLEFTSAVRPAVITWAPVTAAGPAGAETGPGGAAAGPGGAETGPDAPPAASGDRCVPDFRYLVVPLRMPGST